MVREMLPQAYVLLARMLDNAYQNEVLVLIGTQGDGKKDIAPEISKAMQKWLGRKVEFDCIDLVTESKGNGLDYNGAHVILLQDIAHSGAYTRKAHEIVLKYGVPSSLETASIASYDNDYKPHYSVLVSPHPVRIDWQRHEILPDR